MILAYKVSISASLMLSESKVLCHHTRALVAATATLSALMSSTLYVTALINNPYF